MKIVIILYGLMRYEHIIVDEKCMEIQIDGIIGIFDDEGVILTV